ncbi:PilZ domain-containing protein [Bdellovibrio sp. HCB185ZH]|uniref:PilZ domain-containing protein n=1 Tax=Bdellovibrio TaxID=958 RepID=UPI0015E9540B|nr:PilZ domain-containing protein [Bdellovibrio sp. KM01]QLY24608.1 PilZ domain-containing protein [Bdellovibrio sp. KM01]
MTSLARYHGRSPRFILQTEDESIVRVAGPKQVPWEEGTSIKNVSLTGLAFTAPDDLCPILGEVIKIQFTPPGSRQMACYGIVTRLDSISNATTLVGVHFYKMEMTQRIVLAQGLARRFKENQERGQIDEMLNKQPGPMSLLHFPQLMMMGVIAVLWGAVIFGALKFQYEDLFSFFTRFF